MRNSFRDLETRLSKLEQQMAAPTPCNCRGETRFHNSRCLEIVLEKTVRECPVHGFREMGFFFWTASQYPILDEDNQFCPCAPHAWRSFLLGPKPLTWEGNRAANQAWEDMPKENYDITTEGIRTDALIEAYHVARNQWIDKTHRRLPSNAELRKQAWKRAGKRPPR